MVLNNYLRIREMNAREYSHSSSNYKAYMQSVKTTSNASFGGLWSSNDGYYGHPSPFYQQRLWSPQPSQTNTTTDYNSSRGRVDLVIGSGSTAPSAQDYALESEITGFSVLSGASNFQTTGVQIVRTYQNSLASAFTINEVGVLTMLGAPVSSGTTTFYSILLTREVLSTPLVVQPGEVFTVVVTLPY